MARAVTLKVPRKGIATGKAKISYETSGFQGEVCTIGGGFLKNALGVVESTAPTSEMYEEPEQSREHLRNDGDGA